MNKSWQWPAGIILTLALFLGFMSWTWFYYHSQQIDLVTENYYDKQIAYQEQIERIQRARELPEPLRLAYIAERRQLEIRFPAFFSPEKVRGSVTLYRPSDAGMDFPVPLGLDREGKQIIPTAGFAAGLWRVKISWEAEGLEYYHEEAVLF